MKVYKWHESKASQILDLGITCTWVTSFKLWVLHSQKESSWDPLNCRLG